MFPIFRIQPIAQSSMKKDNYIRNASLGILILSAFLSFTAATANGLLNRLVSTGAGQASELRLFENNSLATKSKEAIRNVNQVSISGREMKTLLEHQPMVIRTEIPFGANTIKTVLLQKVELFAPDYSLMNLDRKSTRLNSSHT